MMEIDMWHFQTEDLQAITWFSTLLFSPFPWAWQCPQRGWSYNLGLRWWWLWTRPWTVINMQLIVQCSVSMRPTSHFFAIAQTRLAWLIHYSVCASICLFYVEKFIRNVIFFFTANKLEQIKISSLAKHSEYIIKSFGKLCKYTR